MSRAGELYALAARCEAATGDSFDLNHAIAVALGVASEPFTASLDAALTLVPKGWSFQTGSGWRCDIKEGRAWASIMDQQYGPPTITADSENAATPALALCAAALRARAASGTLTEGGDVEQAPGDSLSGPTAESRDAQ